MGVLHQRYTVLGHVDAKSVVAGVCHLSIWRRSALEGEEMGGWTCAEPGLPGNLPASAWLAGRDRPPSILLSTCGRKTEYSISALSFPNPAGCKGLIGVTGEHTQYVG